jgi:hypothetical protein
MFSLFPKFSLAISLSHLPFSKKISKTTPKKALLHWDLGSLSFQLRHHQSTTHALCPSTLPAFYGVSCLPASASALCAAGFWT